MISLGPISGQKYLQQGYSFTAAAGGAAPSDLLLLCIKLSERSAHTNLLEEDPPPRLTPPLPIGGERESTFTFIKGLLLCQSERAGITQQTFGIIK